MKIVIAPDSFKEGLTALQVASAIEKGIKKVLPRARCIKLPMADGGDGTVQTLIDATGGSIVKKKVVGPKGKPITAQYALLGDKKTAVIEMAEASGLALVPPGQRNPLKTTTFGTGELIIDAMDRGVTKIIVGIGGSATVDGGAGMAQALGVQFILKNNKKLTGYGSGGTLDKIQKIDMTSIDTRIKKITFVVACDVDNPLIGPRGASKVFGPQKGATKKMVGILEQNLKKFGLLIKKELQKDILHLAGSGAAGGLGGGLVAFAGASLKSGIDIVIEATQLRKVVKGADLVITGEGRIDSQTPYGKTPIGVAHVANAFKIPVVAIGGGLSDDAAVVFKHGIDGLASCVIRDMALEEALKNAPKYLEDAAERVGRMLLTGKKVFNKRNVTR